MFECTQPHEEEAVVGDNDDDDDYDGDDDEDDEDEGDDDDGFECIQQHEVEADVARGTKEPNRAGLCFSFRTKNIGQKMPQIRTRIARAHMHMA